MHIGACFGSLAEPQHADHTLLTRMLTTCMHARRHAGSSDSGRAEAALRFKVGALRKNIPQLCAYRLSWSPGQRGERNDDHDCFCMSATVLLLRPNGDSAEIQFGILSRMGSRWHENIVIVVIQSVLAATPKCVPSCPFEW